jgi:hypothetical protein
VTVPSMESERSCMCVLWVSILALLMHFKCDCRISIKGRIIWEVADISLDHVYCENRDSIVDPLIALPIKTHSIYLLSFL